MRGRLPTRSRRHRFGSVCSDCGRSVCLPSIRNSPHTSWLEAEGLRSSEHQFNSFPQSYIFFCVGSTHQFDRTPSPTVPQQNPLEHQKPEGRRKVRCVVIGGQGWGLNLDPLPRLSNPLPVATGPRWPFPEAEWCAAVPLSFRTTIRPMISPESPPPNPWLSF